MCARFGDLPWVDHEILAQEGEGHRPPDRFEIVEAAAKSRPVGEYGETRGAAGFILPGNCRWVGPGQDLARRRALALQLADQGVFSCLRNGCECVGKSAWRRLSLARASSSARLWPAFRAATSFALADKNGVERADHQMPRP